MTSNEIRKSFIEFFKSNSHKVYSSLSLIPDDPTLLLTTAGMVQFKPYFLGSREPQNKRATSVQKCIRTTDIDIVGHTKRHLTFFEMLGNFSFGDYYKEEAIAWAWEYLTKVLNIDELKLWVSVYTDDSEAEVYWKKTGVSPDRIVKLGEEHNFWSAGLTGPCGPCSEIIYDQGEEFSCGDQNCVVGCDCDRFLEIWNLVFMQYDRDKTGKLSPLKKTGIDTGMGLERLASILQGVTSNFETDLLFPIMTKVANIAKIDANSSDEKEALSLRIITDHIKASTFLINDGVVPSNEGRGYILRRLLRRAIRHLLLLGVKNNVVNDIIDSVIENMKYQYRELEENSAYIKNIAKTEEERFNNTLNDGTSMITDIIGEVKQKNGKLISGKDAFKLYDTYGFPIELTCEIANESMLDVDLKKFEELTKQHKLVSSKFKIKDMKKKYDINFEKKLKPSKFVGYSEDMYSSNVQAIIMKDSGNFVKKAVLGDEATIVTETTPYYASSGGQTGDTGLIVNDKVRVDINNTEKTDSGIYLHFGVVSEGNINVGDEVDLKINVENRREIERGHTATHLLQYSLRRVLGEYVKQSGSSVEPGRLRFDFSHQRKLSDRELKNVEEIIFEKIIGNIPVKIYTTSLEYAKEIGATALFGEKYGDFVRVVEVGEISKELCGGTHVRSTGDIGIVKIISESGIGSNLRRIEAIVGKTAFNAFQENQKLINDISAELSSNPKDLDKKIIFIKNQLKELEKKTSKKSRGKSNDDFGVIIKRAVKINDVILIVENVLNETADSLRDFADLIRKKTPNSAVFLFSNVNGRVLLQVAISLNLVEKGFDANKIIKEISPIIDGGGGGRPDFAQAGGKNLKSIPKAIEAVKKIVEKI